MKIVSTNLSEPKTVIWRGRPVETGIFKEPTDAPIELGTHDVMKDAVIDRKFHGGEHKACYLYSADHYPFWKEQFPERELPLGMFGENLTVEGLDETNLFIGASYEVGTAVIQITQPRQPCFKLGIRFENQSVLKTMINSTRCGAYVKVLETGKIKSGDELKLINDNRDGLTVGEVFGLIYGNECTQDQKRKLLADTYMPDELKVILVGEHGVK